MARTMQFSYLLSGLLLIALPSSLLAAEIKAAEIEMIETEPVKIEAVEIVPAKTETSEIKPTGSPLTVGKVDRELSCEESIVGCFATSETSALSVYEPMYFIVGGEYSEDLKARFQFSFKYQVFDQESSFINNLPWLKTFHISYTQTSLWNLSEDSLPFEDTSYKPSLYFSLGKSLIYKSLAFGYAHESNGQAGDTSRSIDALFIQPAWKVPIAKSALTISPRFLYYLKKGDLNQDVHHYRGHTDLNLRYGNEDSWGINTLYRYGSKDHHSVQVDLTYPIRTPISIRTGGFLYIQYFHGYGESLLDYDQKVGPILRIGLGIVR